MKLVELLARELEEWPAGLLGNDGMTQDRTGEVNTLDSGCTPNFYKKDGVWLASSHSFLEGYEPMKRASDYKTAIVTREMWQAERDRKKGGVSHKFKPGDRVKVVSRGRAEWCRIGDVHKVRVCKTCPDGEPVYVVDEEVESCWIRECNLELVASDKSQEGEWLEWDIQFPSGVCSVESKTEQIETPFKWRDEVTELNAYIEKYTRERDALIERLASEGFALIAPVVTAKPYVLPFEEWQVGDVVEVTNVAEFCNIKIKVGDQLPIIRVDKSDDTVSVGVGTWSGTGSYKFIRRP